MTFCLMGIRHHRPIPNSKETAKVPNSWHRLLHRVEAKALAVITEKNIRSFVRRNIICRYRIPSVLVSDNRKQFNNDSFRDFCSQLGIKNHYSSPAHPQVNVQVEVMNRSLESSRLGSRGQRVYGQKSCQAYYGHIGQQPKHLQGICRFD